MPGWHKATQKLRAAGKIQLVGIIQEQHGERCQLFKQWQGLDWPILVDSLNLYGLPSIPIAMAVDEHGILRRVGIRAGSELEKFVATEFSAPKTPAVPLDFRKVKGYGSAVEKSVSLTASTRLNLGAAEFLFGGQEGTNRAIEHFESLTLQNPKNAKAHFRLGVALRHRFDAFSKSGFKVGQDDFEAASLSWSRALELNPGQYIWRRRIQQFGPRLEKPYNFYRWIDQANRDIVARGETPLPLQVPLTQSERMQKNDSPKTWGLKNPDPKGLIPRDKSRLARLSRALVPALIKPGRTARLHLILSPDGKRGAHWDPEAGPIKLWLNGDETWKRSGALVSANELLNTKGPRGIEIEVLVPEDKTLSGTKRKLSGYVIYPICEDQDGSCQFLRQDFSIELAMSK